MAKKKAAKAASANKTAPSPIHTSIYGVLTLAASLLIFLSLASFAYNGHSHHWVGIMGFSIGMILHAIFGISSYIACFFLVWLGWRLLLNKPIVNIGFKILFTILLIISINMLLNVLEDLSPAVGNGLGKFFYPDLWSQRQHYHLGSAPLYYLYRDLPSFNLYRVIGFSGVIILFMSTFLASLCYIFKIIPQNLLFSLLNLLSRIKSKDSLATDELVLEESPKLQEQASKNDAEQSKVSDFMRYVKLRIPGFTQTSSTEEGADPNNEQALQQELLGIQPETNLTARPSLSRKEKTELSLMSTTTEKVAEPISQKKKEPPAEAPRSKREAALKAQSVHNGDFSAYNLPSANLLTSPKKLDQTSLKKDLKKTG